MKTTGWFFAAAALVTTSVCFGQGRMPDRAYPVSYMTQDQNAAVANDPHFASMIHIQVHATNEYPNAVNAAVEVARQARADIAAGRITPSTICVYLHGFAHDGVGSDPEYPAPWVEDLGFFTPSVDSLPGVLRTDFPAPPANRDNRPWRHPFPVNASQASPLKAWFQAFVDHMDVIYDDAPNPLPHPSTWRYYFDAEPYIYLVGAQNGVFIPWYLASTDAANHIWSTWPVPGSAGYQPPTQFPFPVGETRHGKTLAELYQNASRNFGWTVPATVAFDDALRADDPAIRKYMIWWYHTWHMALDGTMENVAWSVLKTKWPGVRFGNWDQSSYDGTVDTTGWYVDWDQSPPGTTPVWSNLFPRCFIDPSPAFGAPPYTKHNAVTGGTHHRWVGLAQQNAANTHSPICYPLNGSQDVGPIAGGGHGHRQINYYSGATATEVETTLRLLRHNIASIINSGVGHNEDDTSPWLAQFAAGEDPFDYYTGEEKQRRIIAMMRAFNIPEFLQWSGTDNIPAQRIAWEHTRSMVKRVYLASVDDMKVISGTVPLTSWEHDLSMLEYTLRDEDGLDYTADIEPTLLSANQTVLDVEFKGLGVLPPLPPFDPGEECNYRFEVNFECVAKNVSAGRVDVLADDPTGSDPYWVTVHNYSVITPDQSVRQSFFIQNDPNAPYINSSGHMRLRFIHTANPGALPILSRYDLVQVIPALQCSQGLCCGGEGADGSDMNYDGQSDTTDMDMFMANWTSGGPSADLNLDEAVDNTDLLRFLDAYAGVP